VFNKTSLTGIALLELFGESAQGICQRQKPVAQSGGVEKYPMIRIIAKALRRKESESGSHAKRHNNTVKSCHDQPA
jgi:hypothetical protein